MHSKLVSLTNFLLIDAYSRLKILGGNIWLDWQKIYYLSHLMSSRL
ncbi:hypothetical protein HanPSC8_Chr13g0550011 [Helianthus annuus]|nr:hypothetical protein HanPSC8_Chr13g0550011 [Helianthus annuus]